MFFFQYKLIKFVVKLRRFKYQFVALNHERWVNFFPTDNKHRWNVFEFKKCNILTEWTLNYVDDKKSTEWLINSLDSIRFFINCLLSFNSKIILFISVFQRRNKMHNLFKSHHIEKYSSGNVIQNKYVYSINVYSHTYMTILYLSLGFLHFAANTIFFSASSIESILFHWN